jgi:hypothetical protein
LAHSEASIFSSHLRALVGRLAAQLATDEGDAVFAVVRRRCVAQDSQGDALLAVMDLFGIGPPHHDIAEVHENVADDLAADAVDLRLVTDSPRRLRNPLARDLFTHPPADALSYGRFQRLTRQTLEILTFGRRHALRQPPDFDLVLTWLVEVSRAEGGQAAVGEGQEARVHPPAGIRSLSHQAAGLDVPHADRAATVVCLQ